MPRALRLSGLSIAVLAAALSLPSATHAQSRPTPRFELTPFGGYQWGGSFDTDASLNISAGELSEQSSFSWGTIASFTARPGSSVELLYLRQDTKVDFDPDREEKREVGDFANNYILIGLRQDLNTPGALRPFFTTMLGMNVLDPDAGDAGTSTRFAWSLGGGARYMAANGRVGMRLDLRWLVTPVPSGDYGSWCSYWGCYAVEETAWLHQGQVGAGIILAF